MQTLVTNLKRLGARAWLGVRKAPLALKLLMVVGLINALAWAAVIAPLTGPDEDNHASYIMHLAETGSGPSSNSGHKTHAVQMDILLTEAQLRAMGTNAGSRPNMIDWDAIAKRADETTKAQRTDGDGPNPVAFNPPLYYYASALVYRLSPDGSLPAKLFTIRAATALLMPIMVLLAWLIAAELFAATWPRALTAAMVALQPKMGFMAGTINPDALMITFFTATILMGLRVAKNGATARNMFWLGLWAGGATMTHGRGIAAVPLALLAAAIGLQKARPALKPFLRQAGALLGAIAVPALIAFLYTRAHNTGGAAFGGEVSEATTSSLSLREFLSSVWQFYLPRLDFMAPRMGAGVGYREIFIVGFFGEQGGLDVNFARGTYGLFQLVAGCGLVAFFVVAIRRFEVLVSRWREVLVLLGAAVSLMLLLHISEYRDVQQGADALLTGRYILPIVTLYGLAIAFVANSLPKKWGAILAGATVSTGLVVALGALGNAVERLNA